jgi:hypothetical protein
MSKQQGEQLLMIVNRIASDRLDPKLVMDKLDQIRAGVTNIQGRRKYGPGSLWQ